jgi:hypothetical protein
MSSHCPFRLRLTRHRSVNMPDRCVQSGGQPSAERILSRKGKHKNPISGNCPTSPTGHRSIIPRWRWWVNRRTLCPLIERAMDTPMAVAVEWLYGIQQRGQQLPGDITNRADRLCRASTVVLARGAHITGGFPQHRRRPNRTTDES